MLKISVITPSFNQGRFLEETIKSVLDQDYTELEYIIIDGGSTDNSLDIIKKYAPRLKYWISEKDNGQAEAINKGMKLATGDIIAFLNSDDLYLPGTLKFVAEKFSLFSDIDFLYGDTRFIDESGLLISEHKEIGFDYLMGCFFGFGPIIPQPSSFWRAGILKDIGFLNEDLQFNLDGEYFSRIARSRKIKHISRMLSCSRFHDSSKTQMNITSPSDRHFIEHLEEVRASYSSLFIARYISFDKSKALRWVYRLKRIIKRFMLGHYFTNYHYRHIKI